MMDAAAQLQMAQETGPDPAADFRAALEAAGLVPGEVVPDGELRTCPTETHPTKKNGRYKMWEDARGGWFQDHADGRGVQFWAAAGAEPLTEAELKAHRAEIEAARIERERRRAEEQAAATEKARDYLATLAAAGESNSYLSKKGVAPCPGLLADGDLLVVPVMGEDRRPTSYQRINPDGGKKFAKGCPTRGGFFPVGPKGADAPLLVAEGLATGLSCHEATTWPALVAFNAGNLAAVAKMARTRYPDRRIILCADNDTETEARTGQNPGVDAARSAARAVGGLLAIPDRPGDFNDLATAEGIEAVQAIIERAEPVANVATVAEIAVATANEWPEPLPLAPDERAEPYPAEALSGVIGEAVAEVTGFVQCPLALTACSALAAVSTVAAGLVDVRRAGKLSGPTGLYFLALAESGERKTTVDGFFAKVIRQWEAEQEEAHRPELQAYRAADAAWTAERDGLVLAIKEASKRGKPTGELKEKLSDHEARKPERPKVPRLLVGDATSEALTWRLANRWPVGGILNSEAGAVFGGHAMGRDSIMRNLATLNTLWDALPMAVDRRTSESFTVRSARLTAGLAAQPGTVRQWLENCRGLARDSGFLARFLLAWPETTQGRRMFQEAPEHWPALARFHRRLADLLDHPVRLDDLGQLDPAVLDLDPAAKDVWIEFHNTVEAELAPGGDMAEARDVASKAGDNAARMAALFHAFEHGPSGTIGGDHMQRAARIVAWHLFEARRFLNQIAVPEAVGDAMALEAWLVDYCRREGLTVAPCNRVQKFGPNRTRRKPALDAALNELEGAGRIRRATEGRKAVIFLHPEIKGGNHGSA